MTAQKNENSGSNDYLTPQEFAKNLLDKREFFAIIWDSNKFRLNQRVSELMKLGYQPYGTPFVHPIFDDIGSGHRMAVKNDVCIAMIHPVILKEETNK